MAEFDLENEDVLEARSEVFLKSIRVAALDGGKWAIYSQGGKLLALRDTLEENVIREYCREERERYVRESSRPEVVVVVEKNVEDLGL